MKWLSQYVVRTSSLLILAAACLLVIVGLMTYNNGNSASFSTIFLAFTIIVMLIIFWNFFTEHSTNEKISSANPGVLEQKRHVDPDKSVELSESDSIPNPLDSGLDIPLM